VAAATMKTPQATRNSSSCCAAGESRATAKDAATRNVATRRSRMESGCSAVRGAADGAAIRTRRQPKRDAGNPKWELGTETDDGDGQGDGEAPVFAKIAWRGCQGQADQPDTAEAASDDPMPDEAAGKRRVAPYEPGGEQAALGQRAIAAWQSTIGR
jgi:hypothetical protein